MFHRAFAAKELFDQCLHRELLECRDVSARKLVPCQRASLLEELDVGLVRRKLHFVTQGRGLRRSL